MTTTTNTWSAPATIATALSTELNALGIGSYSAASAAIDNRTLRHKFIDLRLRLASLTPTATNTGISVYAIPSIDESTWPDGGGTVVPGSETLLAVFSPLSTTTGAKARDLSGIDFNVPYQFKLILLNGAGVALGATGNTLAYRLHSDQNA